ncbi:MAG: DNA internalization-related competence protein ComEC/Rec2 [Deltaproteobacteria bacterium]|nr:MAG: DNA internalization-related competence protein ComEC/Rec2 [Deltaproteobacteria bacterium]
MVQLGGILALCAGVLFARAVFAALFMAIVSAILLNFSDKTKSHLATVNFAFFLLLVAGYISGLPPAVNNLPLQEACRVRGTVIEDPAANENGYNVLLEATGRASPPPLSPWKEAKGRVQLTVSGALDQHPSKGDFVYFRSTLRPPRGFRNPGAEWYEEYLWRNGVSRRAFADFPGEVLFLPPQKGGFSLQAFRKELSGAIVRSAGREAGGVLAAITTGDRSWLSPQIKRLFRNSGTAHLLAVSALHLGIVALAARFLIFYIWVRIPRLALFVPAGLAAPVATLPLIFWYLALTGFQTSTLRATVMVSLLLLANLLSRRVSYPSLLASAVLILAVLSPMVLFSPALHLSVAAILGLFWILPALEVHAGAVPDPFPISKKPLRELFERGLKGFVRLAKVSVAASIATFPVSAYHFGEVSYQGVIVNPIVVPLICFFALPLSLAGALIHPLFGTASELLWRAGGAVVDYVISFERFLAGWGVAKIASAGNVFLLVGEILMLFLIPYMVGARRGKKLMPVLLLSMAMITWGVFGKTVLLNLSGKAFLHVLDVGRGQAVLLQLPSKGIARPLWILVDGGGIPATDFDVGEAVVSPALKSLGCDELDIVISTHPHPDHALGLSSVIKELKPNRLLLPRNFYGDKRYEKIIEAANHAATTIEWRGSYDIADNFNWGKMKTFGGEGPGENDSSMAVLIEYGGRRVLIPGDLEIPGQLSLLGRELLSPVDILLAPHHGSGDAVEERFFNCLSPELIIASSGAGTGLPSDALMVAADKLGARLLTTAESGAVKVEISLGEVYFTAASR